MQEADRSIYRDMARQEAAAAAERTAPNAALCGARQLFPVDAPAGQTLADEAVEAETDGAPSARQSRAAAMLATGMTVREVAIILGLHRGTIFRWQQSSPTFKREQQRCAAEAASELSIMARRLLVKATGYVDRLMEEDCSRSDWAARILRNRRLWDLALGTHEEVSP